MAEIIKARVWQKVDTESNWNANPLILGPGEQAFVVSPAGVPINFKVGDGTKRFSALPWSIQYAGGQYIRIVGNVLPAPTVDAGYSLVGPGTYTFAGQANIVAPPGRLSQLSWDGTSWFLVDMGELPIDPADGVISNTETSSVSGRAVYRAINKYPYEKHVPFAASITAAGIDRFLIDAYFDFEYEDGFRYAFSVVDKTPSLRASLYKHVDGQPPSGNVTLISTFSFTKIPGGRYYLGLSSSLPNCWVLADFDAISDGYSSTYYTTGIGISPRCFKNGKPTPLKALPDLGNSESDTITQKKITEEINAINSEFGNYIKPNPDTLTINNVKISPVSYEHSEGDYIYEGGGQYTGRGVGSRMSPKGRKLLVRKIGFNMYCTNTSLTIKVTVCTSKINSNAPDSEDKTIVEVFNFAPGEFKSVAEGLQYVVLSEDLVVAADDHLYVYAENVGATTGIRIRIWNLTSEGQPDESLTPIKFNISTPASWTQGTGLAYLATPLKLFSTAESEADLEAAVQELQNASENHENRLDVLEGLGSVEVILPDKIHAVVGDTIQLFYRGIIKAVNPYNYNIVAQCPIGRHLPRYYELFNPTVAQIGSHTLTISVFDSANNLLAQKSTVVEVVASGTSPANPVNYLAVGDSLTAANEWGIELYRRLTGSGGSPVGRGFSNFNFKGRKTNGVIGWEGNGGWTWNDYTTSGRPAYRFLVSGVVNPPVPGNTYTNNGVTFTVAETNITAGSGEISATFPSGSPQPSGLLTRASGSGDETITFSSATLESANPFWNSGQLDFKNYVDTYMDGDVDVVSFLLTWNGQSGYREDFTSMTNQAKVIFNHIHAEYPDVKIKLMGIQLPSLNGGMGMNYGATGGLANPYRMAVTALNMNKAYQDLANDPAYSSFVEFVNISAQFDSENNMPESDVPVNTRSSKTEKRGTNGVHPATPGYYQIADAMYRNFIANYCQ